MDDRGLEAFFRLLPPGAGGGCPEDGVLTGHVEGTLLPHEQARFEEHLQWCPRCVEMVGHLVRRQAAPAGGRGPRGLLVLLQTAPARFALAAAVVLGAVLLVRTLWRPAAGGPATDETLVAAASELARSRPDLFPGGFLPLARAERLRRDGPLDRRPGRLTAVYPAGRIVEGRPWFRWEGPSSAARLGVVVRDEGSGRVAAEIDVSDGADRAPWPAGLPRLEPGSYYWRISGRGPLGEEADGRRFAVVSPDEAAALEAAFRGIDREAPPVLRRLLRAHLALRRGFLGEALAEMLPPADDTLSRETREHVLHRLGACEPFLPRSEPAR